MAYYKESRLIDGKPRTVIVDENSNIINKNPKKEELKDIGRVLKNKNKYTDRQLLNYLIQFYEEYGKVPIANDFVINPKYPGSNIYHTRFGSWNKALEMVGLYDKKEKRISVSYADKELLDYLKQFYEENGRTPMQDEFARNPKYPSWSTYVHRFGSWNKALEMAGLDINYHASYTDEQLLNYLKQFYNETGKAPTETDFRYNKKYPSITTYIKHFGSWNKALKLVGLDVDTLVENGVIRNTYQKGRYFELIVKKHFKELPIDLSGKNRCSPFDGICQDGTYEVKSVGLREGKRWCFPIYNKEKEEIEWYYLGAFNEDYSKLLHAWRIPGELIEKDYLCISIENSYKKDTYCVDSMKEFDITDKMIDILKKYEFFEKGNVETKPIYNKKLYDGYISA